MAVLTTDSLIDCDSIPDFIGTGSTMIFYQSNAPTSWTKVTDHDDKALRVVSGTAGSGGIDPFTTVFANRTQPTNANTGNSSLSSGQIASHPHPLTTGPAVYRATASPIINSGANTINPYSTGDTLSTTTVGGSPHNHPIAGNSTNFRVLYVDVIFATKN